MGATPELRDLSIKAGLESHAVDISQEMMSKFSKLMDNGGNRLDKRIICDWLKMNFPDNNFGVIMGDASLINLPTRSGNLKLIKKCRKFLKSGGYLVLRQLVYPETYKGYKKAGELINDYRKGKVTWEDFFMELRMITFRKQVFNQKTCQFDAGKAFKKIEDLYKKSLLKKEEFDRINLFRNNIINTFFPEKEFVKTVEGEGFKLVRVFKDKPHLFFNYLYMMVFQKE